MHVNEIIISGKFAREISVLHKNEAFLFLNTNIVGAQIRTNRKKSIISINILQHGPGLSLFLLINGILYNSVDVTIY